MTLRIIFTTSLFLYMNHLVVMAQTPENKNTPSFSLNHIAVYVHDLKKSTDFYENVMQLRKIPEPFKDGRHTWFSIGDNSQLHLIQGAPKEMQHDKNNHLCFSVKSVDVFVKRLDKYDIDRVNWVGDSKEPNVRVDGVKQIYFQDPDGYWLEVNDDYVGRK